VNFVVNEVVDFIYLFVGGGLENSVYFSV